MLLIKPESAAAQRRDRTFEVSRDLPLYEIKQPKTLIVLSWAGLPRDRPLYTEDPVFADRARTRGFTIAPAPEGAHVVCTTGTRPEGAVLMCHHLLERD